eukprot:2061242-Pyramimonas_sp.AAC.1
MPAMPGGLAKHAKAPIAGRADPRQGVVSFGKLTERLNAASGRSVSMTNPATDGMASAGNTASRAHTLNNGVA